MKTICAWCEHEGKTVVLAERESTEDLTVSYSICDFHASKLVSKLHKYYPPNATRRVA